ncbi:MAG: signal peptidase I [Butyrivibrio sp.]|nr:signal peptidase I [Butyrivibrio sp.]
MARKRRSLLYKEEKKILTPALFKEILSWLFFTAFAIFLALMTVMAFGMRARVIGDSMSPSLYSGQFVLINRVSYIVSTPKRDDIIAFLPNGNSNSHYYIKRVVALPGETVQIIDGVLYVDGKEQSDDEGLYDKMEDAGIAENEIKLGSNEYFVLGDNRNSSEDSRSANIGIVSGNTIAGKVWYKYGGSEGSSGFILK